MAVLFLCNKLYNSNQAGEQEKESGDVHIWCGNSPCIAGVHGKIRFRVLVPVREKGCSQVYANSSIKVAVQLNKEDAAGK